METTVTLLVTRGSLAGRQFIFGSPTTCIIGRSHDCTIALPIAPVHLDVSRHHCLLEISPPSIRLRDLGSLNGTYLNGKKIGQRAGSGNPSTPDGKDLPLVTLIDGDEIRLGEYTAFRVCVYSPSEAGSSVPKKRRSSGELRFEVPIHS
jgi:pSer/pThr/pTyr-binding forkhead associated (FHA) protein